MGGGSVLVTTNLVIFCTFSCIQMMIYNLLTISSSSSNKLCFQFFSSTILKKGCDSVGRVVILLPVNCTEETKKKEKEAGHGTILKMFKPSEKATNGCFNSTKMKVNQSV